MCRSTADGIPFTEPDLPNVHAEDRPVVRNALYAAHATLQGANKLDNWSIQVLEKNYVINMYLAATADFDINLRDLQTITEVSPLRVLSVSIARVGAASVVLKVIVANRDQPLMLTETDVVRVRKRRRFFGIG